MRIGIYVLVRELGRGGMAQVWLAHRVWDDGNRRPCVIKLPRRSAVANESMLRQFLEEARLSILLCHSNIVNVFDAGVHNGLPYLVMDYIPGKDLSQLLQASIRVGARWDLETAIHVVREVGQGLLYAHTYEQSPGVPLEIVHRDVASKNVMLDGTGAVRLMDFGVATSLSTTTSRIHIKGTLPYMAPEHYLGQATKASDVFGLGTIFWEMLAGRTFRAGLKGQDLIAKVVEGAVEPVGRELPVVVQRVLDGMLHSSASNRITLPEVLQVLEKFPYRRSKLREMMEVYFGRAGRRTGLSQLHFVASKELVDTIAVAKAAGVSLSEFRQRRRANEVAPIPQDFQPIEIPDTGRIDPMAVAGALDDDLDEGLSERDASATDGTEREDADRVAGTWARQVEPNVHLSSSETANANEPQKPAEVVPENIQLDGPYLGSSTTAPSGHAGQAGIWSKSGDTWRDGKSHEPVATKSEPTVRLSVETAASASALLGEATSASAKRPADLLPPPAEASASRTSVPPVIHTATSDSARGVKVQPFASIGLDSQPSHHAQLDVSASPRGRTLVATNRGGSRLASLGAAVALLALGMAAWVVWPITRTRSQATDEPMAESVVAVGTPMTEASSNEGVEESESELPRTVAKELPADPEFDAGEDLGATGSQPGEPMPSVMEPVQFDPAPDPAGAPAEPKVDAERNAAKPAPKLEVVVRRGLVVGFAEVRIGRGRIHEVPARGATTLRVSPGTYTVRYRSEPNGAWQSIRQTFSPGMKYGGHVELNGLHLMAMPDQER